MNKHFKNIGYFSGKIVHEFLALPPLKKISLWYGNQSRKGKRIVNALSGIFVIFLIVSVFFGDKEVSNVQTISRKVTLAPVSELSNQEGGFPLIGTVTSINEAVIRSETSGKLNRVYKKLGDSVYAGAIIAEFDNSGERASLLQAEGVYEQAKASRMIAGLNSGQAGSSLNDTKSQALNTISSAYGTMDDAISGKTDASFSDAKFEQAKLLISVPDANLTITIESKRKQIEKILRARELKNKTLSTNSDLVTELNTLQNELQTIKAYLDDLFTAYTKAIPDASFNQTTLDIYKGNVQSARVSVSSTLTSVVGSRTALSSSITANQVAGGISTEVSGALAQADAQVKQALGAYNGALSRLEKTVIRSPLTGTINSLSINTGDYIGAFTQVAVISNNGALEVVSFVTEDDAKRITAGSPVLINTSIAGVVTRIASAIDPVTKKIEVRIGIKDIRKDLVNGQSVKVLISKNKRDYTVPSKNEAIIIPLSSLKLTPQGASVFSVSASGTLVAHPVKEGAILGEQIQILEGLQGHEEIVVDARGLKEGMKVSVEAK